MYIEDKQKIEVLYEYNKLQGTCVVRFETTDEKEVYKILECVLPTYTIKQCKGFNEAEKQQLFKFCKHDEWILLSMDA